MMPSGYKKNIVWREIVHICDDDVYDNPSTTFPPFDISDFSLSTWFTLIFIHDNIVKIHKFIFTMLCTYSFHVWFHTHIT